MGNAAAAGYSGTPLAKKLGIGAGATVLLAGTPETYRELLEPLPPGVRFVADIAEGIALAHLFVTSRIDLETTLPVWRGALAATVPIWVSWPKKASKRATDLSEDVLREVAMPLGLVDVKVCAVDAVWSGLKLVVRKTLR